MYFNTTDLLFVKIYALECTHLHIYLKFSWGRMPPDPPTYAAARWATATFARR